MQARKKFLYWLNVNITKITKITELVKLNKKKIEIMKATFEMSIIIDGNKVETPIGMQKGAEDISMDKIEKVFAAVAHLQRHLQNTLNDD